MAYIKVTGRARGVGFKKTSEGFKRSAATSATTRKAEDQEATNRAIAIAEL